MPRAIINGMLYDTDTAYNVCNSPERMYSGIRIAPEALFRTPKGRWFLYTGETDAFEARDEEEAQRWLEAYADVDTVLRYFDVEYA